MESSISFFGRFQEGGAKWREGGPSSDGAGDYAPRDEGTVLSVGVACKSWAMFGGKVVPQGRYKYSGGVLANDGLQYIGCFLALVSQATAVTTPEAYGGNPPVGWSTLGGWTRRVRPDRRFWPPVSAGRQPQRASKGGRSTM